jgi:fumarylacetoacetase
MSSHNPSDFPIHNIPFGIFSHPKTKGKKRLATTIGDQVIDLYELAKAGHFDDLGIKKSVFAKDYLNDFIALGKEKTNAVRKRIQEIFANRPANNYQLSTTNEITLHLPIKIGDYTDFYSSQQHAYNVGVSGQNFHRPKGQVRPNDTEPPQFRPTRSLDIEIEMATIIGKSNPIGQAIDVNSAEEYVFGFLLFNDWSARDIQKWEYVPLGPFLGKNFFSSVSPWVVTAEALAPFRQAAPPQDQEVLPYLDEKNRRNYDIKLQARLIPKDSEGSIISTTNFKYMYWTVAQQIAHHTVNGCNLNIGDLLASGTISGNEPGTYGSMLEITQGGKTPITLPDGTTRSFVEDGDTISITGYAERDGIRVGFGELRNTVG